MRTATIMKRMRMCGVTKPVRNLGMYFHIVSNSLLFSYSLESQNNSSCINVGINTLVCIYRVKTVRTCDALFYYDLFATKIPYV